MARDTAKGSQVELAEQVQRFIRERGIDLDLVKREHAESKENDLRSGSSAREGLGQLEVRAVRHPRRSSEQED